MIRMVAMIQNAAMILMTTRILTKMKRYVISVTANDSVGKVPGTGICSRFLNPSYQASKLIFLSCLLVSVADPDPRSVALEPGSGIGLFRISDC